MLEDKDFSDQVWRFMRRQGFFALKIPKEWGGKGFSTAATSAVLVKLGTASSDLASTVAVPNSLGPGELLVRYGTPEQQKYYLPLLADGTFIPCFGLTGIHSGSDATSLIGSYGVVEERDGEIGVKCTFDKRYITLAPVAGVVQRLEPSAAVHRYVYGVAEACVESTSEFLYPRNIAWTFVNLHAIELPQLRGQRRVDGVGPTRWPRDAVDAETPHTTPSTRQAARKAKGSTRTPSKRAKGSANTLDDAGPARQPPQVGQWLPQHPAHDAVGTTLPARQGRPREG